MKPARLALNLWIYALFCFFFQACCCGNLKVQATGQAVSSYENVPSELTRWQVAGTEAPALSARLSVFSLRLQALPLQHPRGFRGFVRNASHAIGAAGIKRLKYVVNA